jgi:hypothetical protein
MLPFDAIVFGVTLLSALVVLINWKRRRMLIARRMRRGLRGYVSGNPQTQAETEDDRELIVA